MEQKMPTEANEVRAIVRSQYGKVAAGGASWPPSCCDGESEKSPEALAERMGYTADEIAVGEGANLGLGCGNPGAIASLQPGEVVVDLGSGAGFDALIAAPKVGPTGRVIGVDMTPEMLERARTNAVKAGLAGRLEFREGVIEDLPVTSESADVVISNCVINLSPDKPRAFAEAFRVLKKGGRLAVTDIVLSEPLPDELTELSGTYVACIAGALPAEEYLGAIRDAGFVDLQVDMTPAASLLEANPDPTLQAAVETLTRERLAAVASTIFSYRIAARKP